MSFFQYVIDLPITCRPCTVVLYDNDVLFDAIDRRQKGRNVNNGPSLPIT